MTEEATRQQGETLSDEEFFRRAMASPVVRARVEEFVAGRAERAKHPREGLTTEELVEFLREHG